MLLRDAPRKSRIELEKWSNFLESHKSLVRPTEKQYSQNAFVPDMQYELLIRQSFKYG